MVKVRNVTVLIAAMMLICATALAQDPGLRDTLRVAKVTTNAGLKVGVPVSGFNDEDVAAYTFGLTWNSTAVTIDSVSYIGTRLPASVTRLLTKDNPNRRALIGFTDFSAGDPLTSGNGLLFTMWFSVSPSAPDQFVSIDSVFYPPAGYFIYSPAAGGQLIPEFFKGEIKIGNPQPPPVIVLSQSDFTFNAEVGGGNPTSQVQSITNGGGQTLSWTATKSSAWLGVSPSSGVAPSVVVLTCNTIGLMGGVYRDTVHVAAPGATNTPQVFYVTLNLTVPPPTIKLSPDTFYFQALAGDVNPPGKVMNITNIGQGTLNWTATENAAWLSLSSYSGTAPSNITLNVDNTGMTAGVYIDSIQVTAPYATNNPRYAKVRFEVFSAFPVITHSPDSVFAVGSATVDPYPHVLYIKNNGGGVMNWHITKKKPWLTFDIDTGSAVQGTASQVTLSFNRSLVDFGKQFDTITITSPNAINSPVKVGVTFWKMEVPQVLNLSTGNLTFVEVECGTYPGIGSKTFTVSSATPTPPLNWTATHNAPWLAVTPMGAAGYSVVTCRANVAGLAPGVYKDTIVVSSDVSINPPQRVFVTFTVQPTPSRHVLGLNKDSMFYVYCYTQVGSAEQYVAVYNVDGGCIDYAATSTVPWLTPIPASGTTVDSVLMRADAIDLGLGRHYGEIIFTGSTAINSPKPLPVILWIYTFGDANGDGMVNVTDAVYIVRYIFEFGPEPIPVPWSGDVNCDRITNVTDAVLLLGWIFEGGDPPCIY
jgi:hypothetical protein